MKRKAVDALNAPPSEVAKVSGSIGTKGLFNSLPFDDSDDEEVKPKLDDTAQARSTVHSDSSSVDSYLGDDDSGDLFDLFLDRFTQVSPVTEHEETRLASERLDEERPDKARLDEERHKKERGENEPLVRERLERERLEEERKLERRIIALGAWMASQWRAARRAIVYYREYDPNTVPKKRGVVYLKAPVPLEWLDEMIESATKVSGEDA